MARSRDRDHQALAQPLTPRGIGQRFGDLGLQGGCDAERLRRDIARHISLVGKIDAGFGQRLRLDQSAAPTFGAIAEQALQLAERLAALRIGVGIDQIGKTLDRGEVELAVLERAAGELAGQCMRNPSMRESAEQRVKRSPRVRHAAGSRRCPRRFSLFRSGKKQRERFVDDLVRLRIADARNMAGAASGNFPVSALSASPARGPEIRTTATATGGRPEERA